MVIAPANTGSVKTSRKAVTRIDQANSGFSCSLVMPGARILKIVVMKLIAPRIEEAPARWIDKIMKSIAGSGMAGIGRKRRIKNPATAKSLHSGRPLDEHG